MILERVGINIVPLKLKFPVVKLMPTDVKKVTVPAKTVPAQKSAEATTKQQAIKVTLTKMQTLIKTAKV